MKKILSIIFSMLLCSSGAFATDYTITLQNVAMNNPNPQPAFWYITAAGAGTKSGTSLANAAAGFSTLSGHINFGLINSGDTIYICGEIREKLATSLSGVINHNVNFDGNCPGGSPGIINGSTVQALSWSVVSSNVYKATYATTVNGMVIEDNAPLVKVAWDTNEATTVAAMAAYGPGTWSQNGSTLYVLASASDDPTGHTIEISYGSTFSVLADFSGQYIDIKNITFKNAGDYGVRVYTFSGTRLSNIFESNTVYNIFNWGLISINQDGYSVHNNTVHHVVWAGHLPIQTGVGEAIRCDGCLNGNIYSNDISYSPSAGIDLINGTHAMNVYSNYIHDNSGLTNQFAAGVYCDYASYNFIYKNRIVNFPVGISVSSETLGIPSQGDYVFDNVISHAGRVGINVGFGNDFNQLTADGNYFYSNSIASSGVNGTIDIQGSTNNTVFKNNIVYSLGSGGTLYYPGSQTKATAFVADNNVWYSLSNDFYFDGGNNSYAAFKSAFSAETHGLSSDPLYTNYSTNDLHLTVSSPARGAGTDLSTVVATDYDGVARPVTPDIGAYQYVP